MGAGKQEQSIWTILTTAFDIINRLQIAGHRAPDSRAATRSDFAGRGSVLSGNFSRLFFWWAQKQVVGLVVKFSVFSVQTVVESNCVQSDYNGGWWQQWEPLLSKQRKRRNTRVVTGEHNEKMYHKKNSRSFVIVKRVLFLFACFAQEATRYHRR